MIDVESRVSNLETKFEMFIDEVRDFKTEVREQNKMRADEIREMQRKHDADIRDLNKKISETNEKIDSKFDKLSSQIQNIAVAAVIGVGAIVCAVVSVVVSIVK